MRRPDAQGGGEEGLKRRQSVLELPGVSQLYRHAQMGVEVIAMVATFDIRRPTTVVRHSTADSRLLNVGRRPAVGCRMSNVVLWKDPATTQEDAVKDAVTTQEVAPKTDEVAPKGDEVAPKNAVKNAVKPSGDAVKNAVKPSGDAVKNAVKNAVKEFDAGLRETIIEKCTELYCFLRIDPRRTILTAVESLGFSPRSVAQYLNVLKDAHVLEHVGPTNGGTWKFLI